MHYPIRSAHRFTLFLICLSIGWNVFAQHEFMFWEDQDNINSALSFNPAYLTSNDAVFALPSLHAGSVGNAGDPNDPIGIADDEINRLVNSDRRQDLMRTFGEAAVSGNFLSRHSKLMGGALATRIKLKKDPLKKASFRIAYVRDQLLDMQYGAQFADMALSPRFSIEVPYGPAELQGFSMRYMSYAGLAIGGTLELDPFKTYVGANLKLLDGESFIHMSESDGVVTLDRAGSDFIFANEPQRPAFLTGLGGAVDLGVLHRLDRQWSVSASVMDLGSITWKDVERIDLSNNSEVLLGLEPLNNITGHQFLNSAYAPIIEDMRNSAQVVSKVRTSLDGRANLGVTGEVGRAGISAMASQRLNSEAIAPDASQIAAKLSFWVLNGNVGRLRLTGGARYGSDTGVSFSTALRVDLNLIDIYVGTNGAWGSAAPYAKSMLMFGTQLSFSERSNRDRL